MREPLLDMVSDDEFIEDEADPDTERCRYCCCDLRDCSCELTQLGDYHYANYTPRHERSFHGEAPDACCSECCDESHFATYHPYGAGTAGEAVVA